VGCLVSSSCTRSLPRLRTGELRPRSVFRHRQCFSELCSRICQRSPLACNFVGNSSLEPEGFEPGAAPWRLAFFHPVEPRAGESE